MAIDEENYHGINGYMHPGDLQVSSDGTQYHYFTSHIGNNYNAYWWNGNLPETTHSYGLAPVKVNRYIPEGSSSYKIDSWID